MCVVRHLRDYKVWSLFSTDGSFILYKSFFEQSFMKSSALNFICLACAGFFLFSECQTAGPGVATGSTQREQSSLPLDPAVRTGTLPNGFTYYIRRNTEPKERAELYLVNKAGSILEDDDQQGLAHFLEHMNFKGTTHFPKDALIQYLEKTGVKFGADLNAYTSFDETVYQLPIPTDEEAIVKNGMQIMRDWAQEATLDASEIDKERGVVLEEKRLRKGAGQRLQDQYLPMLLNNSRYAERLPIGTEEVLTGFDPAVLRRFHRDWYRPNLQALIVVGDIDVDQIEAMTKTLFSDLKNPADPRPRTNYSVALTGKNQFMKLTDSELSSIRFSLYIKYQEKPIRTAQDYRNTILKSLINRMVGARYREMLQQPDPPFAGGSARFTDLLGGLETYGIDAVLESSQLEEGIKAAWRETIRAKRFGFTETELARAKEAYVNILESALREKDKTSSHNFVQEYIHYFLKGEAAPGIQLEYDLTTKLMQEISLQEINRFMASYITTINRDILLLAPQTEAAHLPEEGAVNAWLAEVEKEQLKPYVDEVSEEALLSPLPAAGKIVSEKKIEAIGVTELLFENGVRVVLKPTDFKNDQIIIQAFSPGGHSLSGDEEFYSAQNADNMVAGFGVGDFDALQLSKKLNGKKLSVSPFIGERYEGFSGYASPDDLETALQLVYLYCTQPRKDSAVFRNILTRSRTYLESRGNDPGEVFSDTVSRVLNNYHYRRPVPSLALLDKIKLEEVFHTFKDRFADAGDFTFLLTGSIDETTIRPMLAQYLGALPTHHRKEEARELGIHPPTGRIDKTVRKGAEDKASVQLYYTDTFAYSSTETLAIKALGDVLQFRLTDRLRKDEGGVYSPGVRTQFSKYPEGEYTLLVQFGCAPANVDKLIAATEEEIAAIREKGALEEDMLKFKAEEKRAWEKNIKTNSYWAAYLLKQYEYNEDLTRILQYPEAVDNVTSKTIQAAANKYLSGKNRIRFVLLPEGSF